MPFLPAGSYDYEATSRSCGFTNWTCGSSKKTTPYKNFRCIDACGLVYAQNVLSACPYNQVRKKNILSLWMLHSIRSVFLSLVITHHILTPWKVLTLKFNLRQKPVPVRRRMPRPRPRQRRRPACGKFGSDWGICVRHHIWYMVFSLALYLSFVFVNPWLPESWKAATTEKVVKFEAFRHYNSSKYSVAIARVQQLALSKACDPVPLPSRQLELASAKKDKVPRAYLLFASSKVILTTIL